MVSEKKDNKTPQELTEDKKFCFKCKKVVLLRDFHAYYGICQSCIDNSSTH